MTNDNMDFGKICILTKYQQKSVTHSTVICRNVIRADWGTLRGKYKGES